MTATTTASPAPKPAASKAAADKAAPGPVNSAFAWLRGKFGASPPAKRPPEPEPVAAPEPPPPPPPPAEPAEAVQVEPPPPSLEEVVEQGRPRLAPALAAWLQALPLTAATAAERTHRLYADLLLAEGGDAAAVEARLAAALAAAGVQVGSARNGACICLTCLALHSHHPDPPAHPRLP